MKQGGYRPGAGRKVGVTNKATTEIKDMIRSALEGVGGQAYLEGQAKENPGAFMTLIGKIIPSDVKATLSGNVAVSHVSVSAEEAAAISKALDEEC